MAAESTVAQALEDLAAAFGRSPSMVAKMAHQWSKHLAQFTDEAVDNGKERWMVEETRFPNLAEFLAKVVSAGARVEEPPGCAECDDTGTRHVAYHRRANDGIVVAFHGLAACDCPRGRKLARGTFVPWREVLRGWRIRPDTVLTAFTSKKQLTLTPLEELGPDGLRRAEELRTSEQKRDKGRRGVPGWHTAVGSLPEGVKASQRPSSGSEGEI